MYLIKNIDYLNITQSILSRSNISAKKAAKCKNNNKKQLAKCKNTKIIFLNNKKNQQKNQVFQNLEVGSEGVW